MIRRLKRRCRIDSPDTDDRPEVAMASAAEPPFIRPTMKAEKRRDEKSSDGVGVCEEKTTGEVESDTRVPMEVASAAIHEEALVRGDMVFTRFDLTDHDILLGRGRTIQERPSSVYFRKFVSGYQDRYNASAHKVKKLITEEVMLAFQADGYRFLKNLTSDSGKGGLDGTQWRMASHEEIFKKISHSFRSMRKGKRPVPKPTQQKMTHGGNLPARTTSQRQQDATAELSIAATSLYLRKRSQLAQRERIRERDQEQGLSQQCELEQEATLLLQRPVSWHPRSNTAFSQRGPSATTRVSEAMAVAAGSASAIESPANLRSSIMPALAVESLNRAQCSVTLNLATAAIEREARAARAAHQRALVSTLQQRRFIVDSLASASQEQCIMRLRLEQHQHPSGIPPLCGQASSSGTVLNNLFDMRRMQIPSVSSGQDRTSSQAEQPRVLGGHSPGQALGSSETMSSGTEELSALIGIAIRPQEHGSTLVSSSRDGVASLMG